MNLWSRLAVCLLGLCRAGSVWTRPAHARISLPNLRNQIPKRAQETAATGQQIKFLVDDRPPLENRCEVC